MATMDGKRSNTDVSEQLQQHMEALGSELKAKIQDILE